MAATGRNRRTAWRYLGTAGIALAALHGTPGQTPPLPSPKAEPAGVAARSLPINLPTALQLAGTRPLDIALAAERLNVAAAQLRRARVLWLPTVYVGADYYRHDGRIQDVSGNLFDTSKSTLMVGAGPVATFAVTEALFEPLAARRVVRARDAAVQTARNDGLVQVAVAYFNVQQARGEAAGAAETVRRAEEVLRQAAALSQGGGGLVSPVEVVRARAELSHRRQVLQSAFERWRTAGAELNRVLRLDPAAVVEPEEPPQLTLTLVAPGQPVDDLIPIGLTNRPELATQQALVQATLARLREERLRPLIPSVLLRGAATNPAGILAGGTFGGGRNESLSNFGARGDFDVQVLWELQNLGLGNRARVQERRGEHQTALLELMRVQDQVAAEVAQAHAEAESAAARMTDADAGVRDALDSLQKNLEGLAATGGAPGGGRPLALLIRPQEAVAAIQALGQAYSDYYGAVADYNRAQFRLYRALGQPAQLVAGPPGACPTSK